MKTYLNTISSFQLFQLLRYSSLILIGIIFTKTALSTHAIGQYETFIFLAGAFCFFWLNGLIKGFLPISKSREKQSLLFNAFVLIQTFSLLIVPIVLLLQEKISIGLLNGQDIPEIFLLVLFIVFGTPAGLVEYHYLLKGENKNLLRYGVISFSITIILVSGPAILGFDIITSMLGLVLSSLVRYIWLWVILIRENTFRFSPAFAKEHLALSTPLVLAGLLSGSAQYIDGFIVSSKFDADTFAIFRYGARELPIAFLLLNALSNSLLASFNNTSDIGEMLRKVKKSVSRLIWILYPLTILLLLTSKPLFPLVFNEDFVASASVFNIYLLIIVSRIFLPQTILTGIKKTRPLLGASALELFINISLSLLLVQRFGINGIAMATVLAYLIEKIYLASLLKRKYNIRVGQYIPMKEYLVLSILTVLVYLWVETSFLAFI